MPRDSSKVGKWAKYAKKYSERWELEPGLKEWIQSVPGNVEKAFCKYCRTIIRAHKSDLLHHGKTRKHLRSVENYRLCPPGSLFNVSKKSSKSQLNALSREKDAEIDNRDEQLRSAHEEIRKLKQELADKDAVIVMLSTKAAILDKATRYKMELQVLLKCLTDAEKLDSSDHVLDSNSLISVQNGSIRDDSSTDSSSSDEESPRMTQTNDIWTKPDTSSGDQRVRTYKIPGAAVKRLGQVGTLDSNNVGHTANLDTSIPSDKEVTLSRYESTL